MVVSPAALFDRNMGNPDANGTKTKESAPAIPAKPKARKRYFLPATME
jgi:hypothetical protein